MYAPSSALSTAIVPRRHYPIGDALGFIDPVTAYSAYQTGTTALNALNSILNTGGNQDAKRQARVDFMAQAARLGSVLAARIIIAAPDNVAGNEDPMWIAARAAIPADVLAQARGRGGFWPVGAPFEMPEQRAAIERELAVIGQSLPPTVNGTYTPATSAPPVGPLTGPVQTLPMTTTTAPYNYLPALLGLGLVGFALTRLR